MIALELSGVHINSKMTITYRFKSWRKDEPDRVLEGKLTEVNHKPDAAIFIGMSSSYGRRIPFDAEVVIHDDQ